MGFRLESWLRFGKKVRVINFHWDNWPHLSAHLLLTTFDYKYLAIVLFIIFLHRTLQSHAHMSAISALLFTMAIIPTLLLSVKCNHLVCAIPWSYHCHWHWGFGSIITSSTVSHNPKTTATTEFFTNAGTLFTSTFLIFLVNGIFFRSSHKTPRVSW